MKLNGKTVLLGVTGGIAVYKAAQVCSRLAQSGADVRVIMTQSAAKFVTPLTFQTLSGHRVAIDTFDEEEAGVVTHIDLADRADLVVVAPATANILAKMAHGIADDMLSTTLLATTAPILAAPAMNVHMYEHPAVRANIDILLERGVHFVEPGVGQLACGYVGKGRLAEPEQICAEVVRLLNPDMPLRGRKLLVTAGGTIERIDPVRYLTNDSSGKMGYAIAEAAFRMGAEVTLVSAKTQLSAPAGVNKIDVTSAQDMYDVVMKLMPDMDIIVKAAAVADYRPAQTADRKLKKQDDTISLTLVKNPDILQAVGERKTKQFVVGFAAETDHVEQHAMDKLRRKKCDLIVANDVTREGAGFGTDTNIIEIYDSAGLVASLPLATKKQAAEQLLNLVAERMNREG